MTRRAAVIAITCVSGGVYGDLGTECQTDRTACSKGLVEIVKNSSIEEFGRVVNSALFANKTAKPLANFAAAWNMLSDQSKEAVKKYMDKMYWFFNHPSGADAFNKVVSHLFRPADEGSHRDLNCEVLTELAEGVWKAMETECGGVNESGTCSGTIDSIRSSVDLMVAYVPRKGSKKFMEKVFSTHSPNPTDWQLFRKSNPKSVCDRADSVLKFRVDSTSQMSLMDAAKPLTKADLVSLAVMHSMGSDSVEKIKGVIESGTKDELSALLKNPEMTSRIFWNDELRSALLNSARIELENHGAKMAVQFMDALIRERVSAAVAVFRSSGKMSHIVHGSCADKVAWIRNIVGDDEWLGKHVSMLMDEGTNTACSMDNDLPRKLRGSDQADVDSLVYSTMSNDMDLSDESESSNLAQVHPEGVILSPHIVSREISRRPQDAHRLGGFHQPRGNSKPPSSSASSSESDEYSSNFEYESDFPEEDEDSHASEVSTESDCRNAMCRDESSASSEDSIVHPTKRVKLRGRAPIRLLRKLKPRKTSLRPSARARLAPSPEEDEWEDVGSEGETLGDSAGDIPRSPGVVNGAADLYPPVVSGAPLLRARDIEREAQDLDTPSDQNIVEWAASAVETGMNTFADYWKSITRGSDYKE
jgi:hypothetical protein